MIEDRSKFNMWIIKTIWCTITFVCYYYCNDVQSHLFAIIIVLVLLSSALTGIRTIDFPLCVSMFAFGCLLQLWLFTVSHFRNSAWTAAILFAIQLALNSFCFAFLIQISICLNSLLNLLDSDLASVLQQHTVSVERVEIDIIRELTIHSWIGVKVIIIFEL